MMPRVRQGFTTLARPTHDRARNRGSLGETLRAPFPSAAELLELRRSCAGRVNGVSVCASGRRGSPRLAKARGQERRVRKNAAARFAFENASGSSHLTDRLASYLPPARLAQRERALVHRDPSVPRRRTRSTRRARSPHRGRGEAALVRQTGRRGIFIFAAN